MFDYLQKRRDIGVYLTYASNILERREAPNTYTPVDFELSSAGFTSSYENAAALANGSPRLTDRVYTDIQIALLSPFTTAAEDAALIKAARTLTLNAQQTEQLDRLAGVRSNTAPDRFGYIFDMGEAAVEAHHRYGVYKEAQDWLKHTAATSPEDFTQALCTMAKVGCEHTSWKAGSLLDAVVSSLETPQQLIAVTAAVPNFMQRAAEVGLLDAAQLQEILIDSWVDHDDIKALTEEYYAEKHIHQLLLDIPPADKLVMMQYAEANPDYQARAAGKLLDIIPQLVRDGKGEKAEEMLGLLNAISGNPLKDQSSLSSAELCVGPTASFATQAAGMTGSVSRRPMVAAPVAYGIGWVTQRADDVSKFKLVHGPETLGAIDVLKLHVKGFNGTNDTDRLRRATFDASTAHLGVSNTSLQQAWGELCLKAGTAESTRLGKTLLAAPRVA